MRKKEEIQESGSKFADGLLMPILAVGAVFLFIILSFYAYDSVMKNKNNNEIVVLDGESGDFKVAPQDPGGMEVEHKDKEVFNTVSGEDEKITNENVKIQEQEQPIAKDEVVENQEKMPVPDQVGEKSTIVIKPKQAPVIDQSLVIDKSKKIIEIAESEVSNQVEEAKKQAKVQAEKAESSVSGLNSEEVKQQEKQTIKLEDAVKKVEEANNAIKAEVEKVKDKTTGENKTVVMFKDKPKSMGGKEVVKPSLGNDVAEKDSYFVQVSSHTSQSEAETAWKKVYSKNSAEIGEKNKNITKAEVGGKTFFRLSYGPFTDRSSASTSCGILKSKGQDCIIQRY